MPRGNTPDDTLFTGSSEETRRKVLQGLAAAGITGGLAGCSGDGGGTPSTPTETETSTQTTPSVTPHTQTKTATPEQDIPKGGTFIDGTTTDSRALNVLRLGDGATDDRVHQVFDYGFIRKGPKYEDIDPYLFEDMVVADDLKSITIKLRPNLKFGDGYGQLTAEDYLYTINNIWTADWFPFTYSYLFNVGKDNTPIEFEKVDKYTIKEKIPESRPFFPYSEPLGGLVPIPKELAKPYVKKKDSKGLLQDEEIVKAQFNGNLGPWDLQRYTEQSVFEFTRAEDYYLRKWAKEDDRVSNIWAEAPFFDQYKIQMFQNDSAARQALKAQEIDRFGIPATKVGAFKNAENVQIYENPFIAYSDYLGINHRVNGWAPMRNTKVRHAFANLYDREFVVKNILNGRATPQRTLYPQWGPYYPDEIRGHKGKIARAKQLLKEGTSSDYGYSGDKFVGPDGEQVELTLVYQSGTLDDLRAAYTKKRFEAAGFKIKQQTTSWTSLLKNYFYTNKRAEGVPKDENIGYGKNGKKHPSVYNYGPWDKAVSAKDWDLMHTLGFSYGPLDPAGTVAALFGQKETFNAYGFTPSKSLVDMRDKAKTASSRDAAKDTIMNMFQFLAQEQPVVFESNYYSYTGYNKQVQNQPESPAANYYVNQNHDIMYFSNGTSGR